MQRSGDIDWMAIAMGLPIGIAIGVGMDNVVMGIPIGIILGIAFALGRRKAREDDGAAPEERDG